jgi:putative acetyltransferase
VKPPLIRAETDADLDAVRRVVGAAFGGDRVPALLDELRTSVAWLGLSFVAEEKDEVVAHVAYTSAWIDAPAKLLDVLVLSPMSVRPDRQRAGVGTALIRESMEKLQGRDESLVFLEGDPGYYSRVGFVAGGDLGFTAPSVRIPPHAFQVGTLGGFDDTQTGALVYPDVFWRHDCVGLRPER